jgi:hypothetical protein
LGGVKRKKNKHSDKISKAAPLMGIISWTWGILGRGDNLGKKRERGFGPRAGQTMGSQAQLLN